MNDRILLARKFHGLGDWILTMSLIKQINVQYPELEVHIDMRTTPSWFYQLPATMDVKAYATTNIMNTGGPVVNLFDMQPYKYYVPHVIYAPVATHTKFLLNSMIDVFNSQTGLKLERVAPLAIYAGPKTYERQNLPAKYIVMPTCGALKGTRNPQTEWGVGQFSALAGLLMKAGFDIVQVGCTGDPLMVCAAARFDCSTHELYHVIKYSTALVSLENGLSHWAGHHQHKTYTLYFQGQNAVRPCHTTYTNQVPITMECPTPEYLCDLIVRNEGPTYGAI